MAKPWEQTGDCPNCLRKVDNVASPMNWCFKCHKAWQSGIYTERARLEEWLLEQIAKATESGDGDAAALLDDVLTVAMGKYGLTDHQRKLWQTAKQGLLE
jgi:hypothetical protein